MKIKDGSFVEFITEKITAVVGKFLFKVFAEGEDASGGEPDAGDGGGSGGDGQGSVHINYEDLIAKARKEEKKKQYAAIDRLKKQVGTLTEQHNQDILLIADLNEKLKKANESLAAAGSGDSEEIKTLKATIKTLEGEKEALDKKVKEYEESRPESREEIEKEVRAEMEKEYEVKAYKASKLAEMKDQILVPEMVVGDTKEDIDASIKAALERSKEIRKSLGLPEQDSDVPPKPKKRTPKSPASPQSGGRNVDLDYLAGLDVRSKEYADMRSKLGLR